LPDAALFEFSRHQFFEYDAQFVDGEALRIQSSRFHRNSERAAGLELAEARVLLQLLCGEVEKRHFREILLEDTFVSGRLSEKEIDDALNPKNYLGTAVKQAETFALG